MSLCLILQEKNSVFIGADTALSVYDGNRFIRNSNDGKKLFEMGKDIVYCSGDMSYIPDIIKNMRIKDGYVDVEHISKYLKGKNFRKCPVFNVISISVIICRVVGNNSYVYVLEPENNFDIVTHIGKQEGIQTWVGGIYNDKCLEIAIEEIKKNHGEVINTYTNTYKRMVCHEIGGNISVYYLTSDENRKIIDNYDLKDGYDKSFSYIGLKHSIIADNIIGKLMCSERMFIGNKDNSVQITGDGIMISNGVIQSKDYSKNESGKETGSIIDLRDGSFSFADGGLVYDEGNLVLKDGLIKSANYNKDEETGSMIDLTNGNFSFAGNGLTYDGENQLQVKGDIEANSIYANEAYELWYNGDRRHVLMSTRETSQSLSGIWGLKLKLNNDTYIDLKERTSMDFESVINVHAHNIHLEGNTYSKTGQIISSDKNLKHNIQELDKEKSSQFIYSLKPSKFKYNNGTSDRFHHGFIAQEIKESLGEEDNAVYVEQKDGTKGLRYEEFIADLVATVQMQNERIKVLEEKLDSMK